MQTTRLNVSPRMKALMQYDKCAGPSPRILVLHGNYWLDNACFNAAADMGWEIARAPVSMAGTMSKEMIALLFQALTEFKPDFILSINLSGMDQNGMFAHLFADLAIPYVTWFVDDPRTIIMGRNEYATDFAIALTWGKAYKHYLEQRGFAEVHVVPLAADHTLFNNQPTQDMHHPPPSSETQ
jgi:spore maturation protein CgeB